MDRPTMLQILNSKAEVQGGWPEFIANYGWTPDHEGDPNDADTGAFFTEEELEAIELASESMLRLLVLAEGWEEEAPGEEY